MSDQQKITLTPEQTARYPEYKEKYDRIQLSTDRVDFDELVQPTRDLYKAADLEEPKNVAFARSPIVAATAGSIAAAGWWMQERDPVSESEFEDHLLASTARAAGHIAKWLRTETDGFDDLVKDEHGVSTEHLQAQILEVSRAALKGVFGPRPESIPAEKIEFDRVDAMLRSLEYFNVYFHGGNTWSYQHEHLVAIVEIAGLDLGEVYRKFEFYKKVTEEGGPRMMHRRFCIISDRPEKQATLVVDGVHRNHDESDAAIRWGDGVALHFVNGVRVPPWFVRTPPELLDPKLLTRFQNAAVRDEFVKRVGLQRVMDAHDARTLDSRVDAEGVQLYALRTLDLGDGRTRPYLQMRNPSTGVQHVEGVPAGISTVADALLYRNGLDKDRVDPEGGADYYQQGDVLFRPAGAKTFKPEPVALT